MDASRTLRDHGLAIGRLPPGRSCSIADVAGVRVGHVTVIRDEPDPPDGRGIARTGVTAIVHESPERMHAEPLAAGVAVLNGAGELTGSHELRELGRLATPVYLTGTMAVGRVYDGAVAAAVERIARVGVEDVLIPVVGECDDSWLSDARIVQVEAADAGRAADAAGARFAQGAVGAGTGMTSFDWKSGIGSSSRIADGHVVGVLVLANFGEHLDLRIDGVPVGAELGPGTEGATRRPPAGSCIAVVATDAPLGPLDLTRLARRAGLGIARTGSVAHHGSGEIFLAFSTARAAAPALPGALLDALFLATVEATEEAVVNSLWHAEDTAGARGNVCRALPREEVLALLRRAGRLPG